jgi:hypothetical protein
MKPMEPLVGRRRELDTLSALVSGIGEQGAPLLVQGAAGVGKSALLNAASAQARAQGL